MERENGVSQFYIYSLLMSKLKKIWKYIFFYLFLLYLKILILNKKKIFYTTCIIQYIKNLSTTFHSNIFLFIIWL